MSTEDRFTDRLSEYLDGELNGSERAAVERHLTTCGICRSTLEELRAVVASASSLEDSGPAQDLWVAVATRIPPARSSARGSLFPPSRRVSFTLPQLAAAGLTLMVLSGGLVWMARSGDPRADFQPIGASLEPPALDAPAIRPANFADAHYDTAVADLEQTLKEGRTKLDPETVRVLEDNLGAIDRAIEQCRRALAGDTANVYLNSHLAEARQRKLALLRRASALAATVGS